MNDWVRSVGNPRRAILDAGPPGLIGPKWGRGMVAASHRYPNQNGMFGRSFRNSNIDARSIMTDASMIPGQDVIHMAGISRNHAPHSATGIPPALSTTGRDDLSAGDSSVIFDHDPASGDILAKQQNGLRNIPNA